MFYKNSRLSKTSVAYTLHSIRVVTRNLYKLLLKCLLIQAIILAAIPSMAGTLTVVPTDAIGALASGEFKAVGGTSLGLSGPLVGLTGTVPINAEIIEASVNGTLSVDDDGKFVIAPSVDAACNDDIYLNDASANCQSGSARGCSFVPSLQGAANSPTQSIFFQLVILLHAILLFFIISLRRTS